MHSLTTAMLPCSHARSSLFHSSVKTLLAIAKGYPQPTSRLLDSRLTLAENKMRSDFPKARKPNTSREVELVWLQALSGRDVGPFRAQRLRRRARHNPWSEVALQKGPRLDLQATDDSSFRSARPNRGMLAGCCQDFVCGQRVREHDARHALEAESPEHGCRSPGKARFEGDRSASCSFGQV